MPEVTATPTGNPPSSFERALTVRDGGETGDFHGREPIVAEEERNIDQIVKDNIDFFISEKNFSLIINLQDAILGSFRTKKAVVKYWDDLFKNPGKLIENIDPHNLNQYSETDQSRIQEILQDITNFKDHPQYLMAYAIGQALHDIDRRQTQGSLYESYANSKREKIEQACNKLQKKLGLDDSFNLWDAANESKINGPVSMHNKFISQMPMADVKLADSNNSLINPGELQGYASPEEIPPSAERGIT